ncbi:hypothetical protein BP6252_13218 [Coleophoma cylindrospora]|uniref:Uncharacterized protein n=1 Tax=Coleophoma cylindrospora TaxID=1849047 RepID=A0A3D8QA68_9HELO|nr:hypothetical protein BP6252_13218 [Coleophoma cylindrospora]
MVAPLQSRAPARAATVSSRKNRQQTLLSSAATAPLKYPIPIPKDKFDRALDLWKAYEFAEFKERIDASTPGISGARSAIGASTTSSAVTSASAFTTGDLAERVDTMMIFDDTSAATSSGANAIAYTSVPVRAVIRKPLSPKARAKAELIRFIGACDICRARRVKCPWDHHDIDSLKIACSRETLGPHPTVQRSGSQRAQGSKGSNTSSNHGSSSSIAAPGNSSTPGTSQDFESFLKTSPARDEPMLSAEMIQTEQDIHQESDFVAQNIEISDNRLTEMVATQAAQDDRAASEDYFATDSSEIISEDEKNRILQKTLHMAARNGDMQQIQKLLSYVGRQYVDINAPDEQGTTPLIYASRFGHENIVNTLLEAGAHVDEQDRNQWSALMWAETNGNKGIVKSLLCHDASSDITPSSGRIGFNSIPTQQEVEEYTKYTLTDGTRRRRESDASNASSRPSTTTAESLFSVASLSSISSHLGIGPEGAFDRLISVLTEDPTLSTLFEEAVERVPLDRMERNLRRLLKLFAVELSKEADTRQQRGAAGFVRQRARNSAHIICSKLYKNGSVPRKPITLPSSLEPLEDESDDDSDYEPEEETGLEDLERFVVTSRPFQTFYQSLRVFVYPEEVVINKHSPTTKPAKHFTPTESSCTTNLDFEIGSRQSSEDGVSEFDIAPAGDIPAEQASIDLAPEDITETSIKNHFLLILCLKLYSCIYNLWLWEPEVPYGKVRVRWECKCGHTLFDDFKEIQPGAATRLEASLNYKSTNSATASSSSNSSTSKNSLSTFIFNSLHGFKTLFAKKPTGLPQHIQMTSQNTTTQNIRASSPLETIYLLLCSDQGIYATGLLQLPVADVNSDVQLFRTLNSYYKSIRGYWWSLISFRTLLAIKFVRFEMYKKSGLVDIRKQDEMPPENHPDYRYAPVPIDIIPPVGERHLMHYILYPDCADDDPRCLEKFPKKLRERLAVCNANPDGTGWGLHLVEGLNMRKIWIVAFVVFGLGSLLWGILWAVLKKSIQDAFTISGFVVALTTLTIGFAQAMASNLN